MNTEDNFTRACEWMKRRFRDALVDLLFAAAETRSPVATNKHSIGTPCRPLCPGLTPTN